MEPPDVADRLALHDLVVAYATTADARDAEGFARLFLDDGTLLARRGEAEPTTYTGHERLAEIPVRLGRYPRTFHQVTNHWCDVDGERAVRGALCRAHHLTDGPTGPSDLVLTIRYHDTYRRTGAGWRFATREVHILWTSEHPVTGP